MHSTAKLQGIRALCKVTNKTDIISDLHSRKAQHATDGLSSPQSDQTDSFSRLDRSGELFRPCLSRG